MPLDVIMPALGMAQDTGLIVAWHKRPGEAVAPGDVLFEVETDKATMEVEAQAAGFLADVAAEAGAEVPVGQVIARILDTASASESAEAPAAAEADASASDEGLPEGREVIMPVLGMAQDSGLLVAWSKGLGEKVASDDTLFEVETDKSTMEVPAGVDGYLAAILAEEGEEVPTGQVIAIVTADAPSSTVRRGIADGGASPKPSAPEPAAESAAPAPAPAAAKEARVPAPAQVQEGRILASPKLRRLAEEEGLDLSLLRAAGHPEPYHVRDLDALRALAREAATPAAATVAAATAVPPMRLTALAASDGLAALAGWSAAAELSPAAMLAGLAGASLGTAATVAVETAGARTTFSVPTRRLSQVEEADDGTAPDLILRDLRRARITSVALGAEAVPVVTLTRSEGGIALTLEAAAGALGPEAALAFLDSLAARIEDPLRHLL